MFFLLNSLPACDRGVAKGPFLVYVNVYSEWVSKLYCKKFYHYCPEFILYCFVILYTVSHYSFRKVSIYIRPCMSWTSRFPVPISLFLCRRYYWFYSSRLVVSVSQPIFGKHAYRRQFGDKSMSLPALYSTRAPHHFIVHFISVSYFPTVLTLELREAIAVLNVEFLNPVWKKVFEKCNTSTEVYYVQHSLTHSWS
jgi:hypothetical protein